MVYHNLSVTNLASGPVLPGLSSAGKVLPRRIYSPWNIFRIFLSLSGARVNSVEVELSENILPIMPNKCPGHF